MSDNYDGPLMAQQILRLRTERDALKAQVEEWRIKAKNWLVSPDALQKLDGYRELMVQRVTAEAQRDALRDALEKIVNAKYYLHPEDLKEIARAAIDAARSKA